jgi:ankyrin repeat protein
VKRSTRTGLAAACFSLPLVSVAWSTATIVRRERVTDQLRTAVREQWPEHKVRALLDAGANPNAHIGLAPEPVPQTWTERLLMRLPHVPKEDPMSLTLLARYCSRCNSPIVKLLLRSGADPNLRSCGERDWVGPLGQAAIFDAESAVKVLLEHGAKVDIPSSQGQTALMLAANCGHTDCIRLLLECGANPRKQDWEGYTALHFAAMSGRMRWMDPNDSRNSLNENVKLLIKFGAEVDAKGADGLTPLLIAVKNQEEDLVRLLLAFGANPNLRDKDGCSAMDYSTSDEITTRLRHAGGRHVTLDSGRSQ